MQIQTKTEIFNEPLYLESGRIFSNFKLKYETYGELNADKSNVIVICHTLTGSHHAAGIYKDDTKAGWWNALIGDKKPVDTKKFFVICVSILGTPFGSTCPLDVDEKGNEYRLNFPVIVISDVVKAQMKLFKRLGIKEAYAVIGGSLGGFQALCFAIEQAKFCKRVIILASSYQTPPWAIAFNKIMIEGIRNDPAFLDGFYDPKTIENSGMIGMALGRMAGHISFLSPNSMDKKFSRNYVSTDGIYELFGRFEIDRYLEYNGYNFPKRYDPLCYLYIAKMMNVFDCTRHYGDLQGAFSKILAKMHLIAFSGDVLFPPKLMFEMAQILKKLKKDFEFVEIQSDYGHDAFLVEIEKFEKYITKALNE